MKLVKSFLVCSVLMLLASIVSGAGDIKLLVPFLAGGIYVIIAKSEGWL